MVRFLNGLTGLEFALGQIEGVSAMLSRREFLKSSLGTSVTPVAQFSQEAAAQPALRRLVVDAKPRGIERVGQEAFVSVHAVNVL